MQAVTVDRDKWLGGSDIGIIMGLSPFKKRYDLLLEKAGLQTSNFEGNKYTEYGNILEPKIREYINRISDETFHEGKYEEPGEIIGYRCHVDGVNNEEDTILEIKTTSQIHDDLEDYKLYLVQLIYYMEHVGTPNGCLAVYHRPETFDETFNENKLQIWTIDRDDSLYNALLSDINREVEDFIKDLEKIKNNPFLEEKDLLQEKLPLDVQRQILMVEEMEKQLKEYKQIEEKQKKLKEQIKTAMQEHGVDKWITPSGTMIKLVADGEDKEAYKINEEKLKEEYPVVYASVAEQTIQKGRAGYIRITKEK